MEALQRQQAGSYTAYTYADYASWDTDKRYELIDGTAYLMAAPSQAHQTVAGEIFRQLANYLKGKPCKVFMAPFDVCLNARGDSDSTVVQPDVLVICDDGKLDGKRCNGAPDLAVEVISESSAKRDEFQKLLKYQKNGVKEYWIVKPELKIVQSYILENGKYTVSVYGETDCAPVSILDGCAIDLADVFADVTA
jgi:Uma2 family endonuclease